MQIAFHESTKSLQDVTSALYEKPENESTGYPTIWERIFYSELYIRTYMSLRRSSLIENRMGGRGGSESVEMILSCGANYRKNWKLRTSTTIRRPRGSRDSASHGQDFVNPLMIATVDRVDPPYKSFWQFGRPKH